MFIVLLIHYFLFRIAMRVYLVLLMISVISCNSSRNISIMNDNQEKDPYELSKDFIQQVPGLVEKLQQVLGVTKDELNYSIESLKLIDDFMNQTYDIRIHNLNMYDLNHLFVAYSGKVILKEIGGGQWQLLPDPHNDGILMAIIKGDNKEIYYVGYKVSSQLVDGGEFKLQHAIKRTIYPLETNLVLQPYRRSFFRRLFNLPPKGLRKAEKELREKKKKHK